MTIINFKIYDNGTIIHVSYESSMTIRHFILDFTKHYSKGESIDPIAIFAFRSKMKILNSPKYLNCTIGDLIQEESTVLLARKHILYGRECIEKGIKSD